MIGGSQSFYPQAAGYACCKSCHSTSGKHQHKAAAKRRGMQLKRLLPTKPELHSENANALGHNAVRLGSSRRTRSHSAHFLRTVHGGPSAPASYGCLSPRGEAAGSRGVEPPCVLQDFMHSRFAGSGTNCLEGELEQGAGEGPLRCHGDDATPAGHVGCTQSRADSSVRARGACLREEPQEGCGFRAAAWRARELGVGFAPFAPCCELKGEAGLRISAWPRLAGASDGANTSGINSKLGPVPRWQAVAHDLDPPRIGYGDREIHVSEAHVAGDPCPSLLADPGDGSLEREGAGS